MRWLWLGNSGKFLIQKTNHLVTITTLLGSAFNPKNAAKVKDFRHRCFNGEITKASIIPDPTIPRVHLLNFIDFIEIKW